MLSTFTKAVSGKERKKKGDRRKWGNEKGEQEIEGKEERGGGRMEGLRLAHLLHISTEFPSIAFSNESFATRIIMWEGKYRACAELEIVSHERIN